MLNVALLMVASTAMQAPSFYAPFARGTGEYVGKLSAYGWDDGIFGTGEAPIRFIDHDTDITTRPVGLILTQGPTPRYYGGGCSGGWKMEYTSSRRFPMPDVNRNRAAVKIREEVTLTIPEEATADLGLTPVTITTDRHSGEKRHYARRDTIVSLAPGTDTIHVPDRKVSSVLGPLFKENDYSGLSYLGGFSVTDSTTIERLWMVEPRPTTPVAKCGEAVGYLDAPGAYYLSFSTGAVLAKPDTWGPERVTVNDWGDGTVDRYEPPHTNNGGPIGHVYNLLPGERERVFIVKVTKTDSEMSLTGTYRQKVVHGALPPTNLKLDTQQLTSVEIQDGAMLAGVAGQNYRHKFSLKGKGSLTMSWTPAEGISTYKIYRHQSEAELDTGTLVGTVTGTTFTDANVEADKDAIYTVRSVATCGHESGSSESVRCRVDLANKQQGWLVHFPNSHPGNAKPPLTDDCSVSGAGIVVGRVWRAGEFKVDVTAKVFGGPSALKTMPFQVSPAPPVVVTTTSLPVGWPGEFYSVQLMSEGGAGEKSWYVQSGSLPDGLTLTAEGLLIGSPRFLSPTATQFTIGVMDGTGTHAFRRYPNPIIKPMSSAEIEERLRIMENPGNWAQYYPKNVPMAMRDASQRAPWFTSLLNGEFGEIGPAFETAFAGRRSGPHIPYRPENLFREDPQRVRITTMVRLENLGEVANRVGRGEAAIVTRCQPQYRDYAPTEGVHAVGWFNLEGSARTGSTYSEKTHFELEGTAELDPTRPMYVTSTSAEYKESKRLEAETTGRRFIDLDQYYEQNKARWFVENESNPAYKMFLDDQKNQRENHKKKHGTYDGFTDWDWNQAKKAYAVGEMWQEINRDLARAFTQPGTEPRVTMAEVHYFNSEFSKDRVQGSKPVRYEYKNGVHLAVMDQSRIHTTVTLDDIAKVAQSRGIGHLGSSATTEAVAKAIAQKTGQPDVEIKVLELTEKGRKFFGFAKRVNVAFGNVSDVYEVFVAEDKVRAVAGVIGGNAGAWAASEMTAAVCAPLLAVPGGAFVYFPVVFTAGYYGYQLGSQAAQQCYEVVVRELPPDVNFVDFTRAFLDQ